jgi:hypothetical protein
MTVLMFLKYLAVVVTLASGAISIFWPKTIKGFTGLEASSPRAISEIRAVMGGTFLGLGIAAFVLKTPEVYKMLGIAYAAIALIRGISIPVDRSTDRSNIISLATEVVLAVVLIW